MIPPKRQIIKTRPQRPYVIARFVIAILVATVVAAAVWLLLRPHPAHSLSHVVAIVVAHPGAPASRQEAFLTGRMALIRPTVERMRS